MIFMNYYIIVSLLLLILSCNNSNSSTQENKKTNDNSQTLVVTPEQQKTIGLRVARPELRSLAQTIRVSGMIDVPPQNLVSVSVPLGGYLRQTKLLTGMHIRKGELIAEIEDAQYIQLQEDYLTVKAKLAAAETEYYRQRDLNASKASSDKALQQAQAEYHSLRVRLSALSEKLKLINIDPRSLSEQNLSRSIRLYAPFNGFVSKVYVNMGKYVNPSDVLFELVNPDNVLLRLRVFEKDLPLLSAGQKLVAFTNAHPKKQYNCEVIFVNRDVGTDRTVDVHCRFLEYDPSLLPGMYMNAVVELESMSSLCVPEQAVVTFEGKNYVFVASDPQKFEITEISTGLKENGYISLNNAMLQDKDVVVEGSYTLLMMLKNKSDEN